MKIHVCHLIEIHFVSNKFLVWRSLYTSNGECFKSVALKTTRGHPSLQPLTFYLAYEASSKSQGNVDQTNAQKNHHRFALQTMSSVHVA